MYHVYLLYCGTLGTDGTRIFGSISFLQKRSLQKLNADKSSGIPPAADIDLIGVLDVVPALILFEERAKALLGKAGQSVIVTPQLVNGVQVFGTDLVICLEADGKSAQLMFVVGSNKLLSHNGWQDNLAFALHLQSDLMEHHTNLMRPISISKNRYNQHVTPFSLIIECGTEANTLAEAKESIKSFASSLDRVLPVN